MKKVIIFPFLHSEKLLTDILYLHRADELDKIEILGIVPSGYYNSIKECCKKNSYHLHLATNLLQKDMSSDDICIRAQGNGTKACDAFSKKIEKTIISNGMSVLKIENFSWNDFFKLHSKDAILLKEAPILGRLVSSRFQSLLLLLEACMTPIKQQKSF